MVYFEIHSKDCVFPIEAILASSVKIGKVSGRILESQSKRKVVLCD